ncbi:unnamed protein product [Rotaria socialis]|uniref:Serpin domain-containing protein n=1 Tax=Rotaria socialis TaxID=392032 RepID=A0A821N9D0_9BILA|nr:unnamed protein product [Rotaria socialis]CAF4527269.1 unnamed protein product [Rotaria socialis]CAF4780481.1 unnamed protein product [Rotaria socialis]
MKDILWILCKTIVRICVAGILIYSAVSTFILPWISLYFPSEKMHETDTSQLEYSSSFNDLGSLIVDDLQIFSNDLMRAFYLSGVGLSHLLKEQQYRSFFLHSFLLLTDTDSIILSSPSTAADLEHFGYELFSNVSQQQNGTNIFLSPTSIALALSMCIAGARDETLNQALRVLHASSIEALTKTVEQIMHMISMTAHNKKVEFKLANRLYASKAYKIQDDYLKLVQNSFQSDVKLEDFENNRNEVVQTINAWVEEQTNRLIQNLLSTDAVPTNTRLIIVNCIYFKGIWKNRFPEILTKKADFYEANGHISKIDVMFQTGKYAYAENDDLHAQIAHLPYQSDNENIQFAFAVILPKQDISLDEVERKLALQPDLMQLVLSDHNTSMTELLLYLPKFKMKASLKLGDVLKQLGMENAFNSTANFTGITSQQDGEDGIFISEVIHKAFIDVNEQGTKAAAATAGVTSVLFSATALKPMPILFKADRPFLFFIRESRQNIVLFSGKLVSPPSAL